MVSCIPERKGRTKILERQNVFINYALCFGIPSSDLGNSWLFECLCLRRDDFEEELELSRDMML